LEVLELVPKINNYWIGETCTNSSYKLAVIKKYQEIS
jgi:hypothetical protein